MNRSVKFWGACAFSLVMGSVVQAETYVRIAASSTGGSWYPLAAKMAEIFSTNIEGLSATAVPGGGVSNVSDVQDGEVEIGWTFAHTAYSGYKGEGPFQNANEDVRFLAALFPAGFQIAVPASSDIHTLKDLIGKRVSPGKPQWSSYDSFQQIIGETGFTVEDIKAAGGGINHVDYSDSVALMKDGNLDAFATITNVPQASFLELDQTMDIRFLPIDPEVRDRFIANNPGYVPVTIPASAYQDLDADIETVGARTILVVNASVPDDLVYEMTRLLWESHGDLLATKSTWADVSLPEAYSGAAIPVHPGAKRYYDEMGVKAAE
ncbi:hypothetical protein P279_24705 [Rhodobacteraceae bacterium PD-2]|nr:hypothetical protein P279_24705 [Rhodobacteraceae bacterium PD-2]